MKTTVAVLAGGRSRRMGNDKATLLIAGRPLLHLVTEAVWGAGAAHVLWIGERHPGPLPDTPWAGSVERVADLAADSGPLGGVVSAATDRDMEPFLVIPCDLPNLRAHDVTGLLDAVRVHPDRPHVGTLDDGRRPDVAWWTTDALRAARRAYDSGDRSLHGAQVGPEWMEVPLSAGFRDVDTPDDLVHSDTVTP